MSDEQCARCLWIASTAREPSKLLAPNRRPEQKNLVTRLYLARDLATKISHAELTWLVSVRSRNGKPLRLYHIRNLLPLRTAQERQEIVEECLENDWTTIQLRHAVQDRLGRRGHLAGRSPRPVRPMAPHAAARDVFLQSRKWLAHHRSWFSVGTGGLKLPPPNDRSRELEADLARARDILMQVKEAAEKGLGQLDQLL